MRNIEHDKIGTIKVIITNAIWIMQIPLMDLISPSRKRKIVTCRMIITDIALRYQISMVSIGAMLNRDHSSISYCAKKHQDFMDTDAQYREWHSLILESIKESECRNLMDQWNAWYIESPIPKQPSVQELLHLYVER